MPEAPLSAHEDKRIGARINKSIEKAGIVFENHQIAVTCSIGGAVLRRSEPLKALLHRAGQAVERARDMETARLAVEQ